MFEALRITFLLVCSMFSSEDPQIIFIIKLFKMIIYVFSSTWLCVIVEFHKTNFSEQNPFGALRQNIHCYLCAFPLSAASNLTSVDLVQIHHSAWVCLILPSLALKGTSGKTVCVNDQLPLPLLWSQL